MRQNFEEIEKEVLRRASERERKRRPRMPVSGKAVFGLQGKLFKSVLKAKMKK